MLGTLGVLVGLVSVQAADFKARDLWGTWRLEKFSVVEGEKRVPRCAAPFGIITYHPNGYMAVSINCRGGGPSGDTPTEDAREMVFYGGRYDLKPGEVHYFVENSSDITRIGKTLTRSYVFKDGLLTLSGRGIKGQVELSWRKVK